MLYSQRKPTALAADKKKPNSCSQKAEKLRIKPMTMIGAAQPQVKSNAHPLRACYDRVRAVLGEERDPETCNGDTGVHEIPDLPEPSRTAGELHPSL